MQFGPSLDTRKMAGLVRGSGFHEFLELNRMAFSERLPRNSESRAIGIACRVLRRMAPHVRWIVTFADATQCGDGTIYRASGFLLTAIKRSENLVRLPSGEVLHKMTLESNPTCCRPELGGRTYADVTGGKNDFRAYVAAVGGTVLPGYQLRYVRFLDPSYQDRLTVPVIPYTSIPADCRMVRGLRGGPGGPPGNPPGEDGIDTDPAAPSPGTTTPGA